MTSSPRIQVGLSTSSVFPESTASAFEIASSLGYDGVEVMVGTDATSQDPEALVVLSQHYAIPILAIHSPCLLITQHVWGTDPWGKLQRAQRAAERAGASTVVVHPPFRWQREYAKEFVTGLHRMESETHVRFAVENMFPWRAGPRSVAAYLPDWDVRHDDYPHTTLDLSHTAVSRSDALEMAADLDTRLAHVHLADGTDSSRDEHLVPGRGNQPVDRLLTHLVASGFEGTVIAEISTRKATDRDQRLADLSETLDFARLHLGQVRRSGPPSP